MLAVGRNPAFYSPENSTGTLLNEHSAHAQVLFPVRVTALTCQNICKH